MVPDHFEKAVNNKDCITNHVELHWFCKASLSLWSVLQPTTRWQLKRFHLYIQTKAGMLGGTAVQLQAFYVYFACSPRAFVGFRQLSMFPSKILKRAHYVDYGPKCLEI